MSEQNNNGLPVVDHLYTGQTKLLILVVSVLALLVTSSIGVVYSSYKSRQLFSYLQQQSRQAMRLEEDWGRLLLEQSTWASHARIERLAKSELNMVVPDPEAIIMVEQ
ncbi:MAG: cell division protein FtsL [Oceanicoccus sp.]|jgi:cell division protein FtsL